MTEKQIISWINEHLGHYIQQALAVHKEINPNLLYTKDWLVGLTYRETGFLIARYVKKGLTPEQIHPLMKGDYGKRAKDKEKCYHGFGYTQIDIDSFPDFVNSGDWKDPYKCYFKAIAVLEGKRKYLVSKMPNLKGLALCKAITAAYNCGEGNVYKALLKKRDVDCFTFNKDYSKEVWRFRALHNNLEGAKPVIA